MTEHAAPGSSSPEASAPNTAPIRLDLVSDVVCPWCIIGFKQLEHAVARAGVTVDLFWHPFELNPHMPAEGQDLREHIAEKYGSTAEQSRKARARLAALGDELGFPFRYADDMRIYNTFQAHQLLHWAEDVGQQTALKLALFDSYFTRREDVSAPAVLVAAAKRAGLDGQEAAAVLDDARYADAVRDRERLWIAQGIHAVPAFVFNERILVSGAAGTDRLADVLTRIAGGQPV